MGARKAALILMKLSLFDRTPMYVMAPNRRFCRIFDTYFCVCSLPCLRFCSWCGDMMAFSFIESWADGTKPLLMMHVCVALLSSASIEYAYFLQWWHNRYQPTACVCGANDTIMDKKYGIWKAKQCHCLQRDFPCNLQTWQMASMEN